MFADEHDGSQSDDDEDGDKITLEEMDENFASLGLDFHTRRGDANTSREVKNAIRDNIRKKFKKLKFCIDIVDY